jgi:integrase
MPARKPRIPSYRRHSSGQARVTLDGQDHLLGPYNSPESQETYRRLLREWLENRAKTTRQEAEKEPLSVNDLILAYWKHAERYYGFDLNPDRGDAHNLKAALQVARALYGRTPARDFGPRSLKACRAEMVARGWARTYVNAQTDRIRRTFRWGVEEELVPASVYEALRAVQGLRRGKCEARESERVRPLPLACVEATMPFLPPTVQAMVAFERLTGCRPSEVCILRPLDLDVSNPNCWVYRPGSDQGPEGKHKTAHHGHQRIILVGPRAQEVLKPFLGTRLDAFCFSPAKAEAARNAGRRERRMTPLWPSHLERLAKKRKARRRRAPGDRYDVAGYRRAIKRACDQAFPPPEPLAKREGETTAAWQARLTEEQKSELERWRKAHRWHPNRLRHSRATELRRFGLDLAKTVLGHAKVETTQLYAEKDLAAAMELVSRVG